MKKKYKEILKILLLKYIQEIEDTIPLKCFFESYEYLQLRYKDSKLMFKTE